MRRVTLGMTAWVLAAQIAAAQTVITPPENKYDPKEDVQLGREAAAKVEQELPILHDDNITSYVAGIGERLVRAIPSNLQYPDFQYSFKVVNVSEINAFALPGGPMYVNRGMMEAAKSEGEIAGVMAHELSHVALRHGTAQATKAQPYRNRSDRRRGARRNRRRPCGQRDLAGHAVRPGHLLPEIQPRIREAGRHPRIADHGARRVRSARDGEHVQDDRGAGRLQWPAVAERPSEPGESVRGTSTPRPGC